MIDWLARTFLLTEYVKKDNFDEIEVDDVEEESSYKLPNGNQIRLREMEENGELVGVEPGDKDAPEVY